MVAEDRWLGTLLGLSSGFLWAVSTTLWKRSVVTFGARVMNFFKCGVSSAYLWITMLCLYGSEVFAGISTHAALVLAGSGILGLALGDAFLFVALRLLGAQPAAVMMLTSPLWSALLGMLFFGEILGFWQYAAIPVVCVGVALVIRGRRSGLPGGSRRASPEVVRGVLAGLTASLLNALGAQLAKQVVADVGALRATWLRLTAATLFLAVLALLQGHLPRLLAPLRELRQRKRELLAVFLGTFLGVMCWQGSLIYVETSVAICLTSTTPLFLLPMAVFFLRERYGKIAVVGTLIAVAGIPVLVLMGS